MEGIVVFLLVALFLQQWQLRLMARRMGIMNAMIKGARQTVQRVDRRFSRLESGMRDPGEDRLS